MTQSTTFVLTPDQQPKPMQVIGTQVTLLSDGNRTPGFAVTHQCGDVGMGPPPHAHDWDEVFYVSSGSVDFTCNNQIIHCEPGSLIFVPGGQVHSFKYGPDGGEMLEITGSGSNAPAMFAQLDAEVPPGPPHLPTIVEVLYRNGVTVHL